MTVPLVEAFSASCSAKPTVAPRPATSDGSSAARVAAGRSVRATPAKPTAARTHRGGGRGGHARHDQRDAVLAATPMMLRDIE